MVDFSHKATTSTHTSQKDIERLQKTVAWLQTKVNGLGDKGKQGEFQKKLAACSDSLKLLGTTTGGTTANTTVTSTLFQTNGPVTVETIKAWLTTMQEQIAPTTSKQHHSKG